MTEHDFIEGYEPDRSLQAIRTLGRLLDDLERVRIMNTNRIGALERSFGEALPHLVEISEPLSQAEHLAELEMVRLWRKMPLAPWAKGVRGLGEKSIARLYAEIGDPSIGSIGHWETSGNGATGVTDTHIGEAPDSATRPADIHGANAEGATETTDTHESSAPKNRTWVVDAWYNRTVSQLWAYCGVGDPERSKIPKGAVQDELLKRGKPRVKKQLYLIATSMLKAGNREVYDAAREHYAERIHDRPCAPCHAKIGDPWKPGHQHMAALRKTEKEFLKELWVEARRMR